MTHSVPSHFGANDSVDKIKVGVRPFNEPEGVRLGIAVESPSENLKNYPKWQSGLSASHILCL